MVIDACRAVAKAMQTCFKDCVLIMCWFHVKLNLKNTKIKLTIINTNRLKKNPIDSSDDQMTNLKMKMKITMNKIPGKKKRWFFECKNAFQRKAPINSAW